MGGRDEAVGGAAWGGSSAAAPDHDDDGDDDDDERNDDDGDDHDDAVGGAAWGGSSAAAPRMRMMMKTMMTMLLMLLGAQLGEAPWSCFWLEFVRTTLNRKQTDKRCYSAVGFLARTGKSERSFSLSLKSYCRKQSASIKKNHVTNAKKSSCQSVSLYAEIFVSIIKMLSAFSDVLEMEIFIQNEHHF